MTAAGYVYELQGTVEALQRQLARRDAAAAEVTGWHQPGTGGQAGRSRRVCAECAFPWPCRTYERLTQTSGPARDDTPHHKPPGGAQPPGPLLVHLIDVKEPFVIDDGPLLDPDCRDGKHTSCAGGPCECPCHETEASDG